jgi:hypothetical protein
MCPALPILPILHWGLRVIEGYGALPALGLLEQVQIGDNRAAEWVRRSNPVALGLLFSGLAGQLLQRKIR